MQLQNDLPILQRAGYQVAAVSYDRVETLAEFAQRKSIRFPLLSDHDSKVIRRYNVNDPEYKLGAQIDVDTERVFVNSLGYVPVYGIAAPAVFLLSPDRRVQWRFVSRGPELRWTGATILARALPDTGSTWLPQQQIKGKREAVTTTASANALALGSIAQLGVELRLPDGLHVYGPDVGSGYKGTRWTMREDAAGCFTIAEPQYPPAPAKHLEATNETLPVYEGRVRITRDIVVKPMISATRPAVYQAFTERCLDRANQLHVSGVLELQACDQTRCYPPEKLSLEWVFRFLPPDRERVSPDLRREFEIP